MWWDYVSNIFRSVIELSCYQTSCFRMCVNRYNSTRSHSQMKFHFWIIRMQPNALSWWPNGNFKIRSAILWLSMRRSLGEIGVSWLRCFVTWWVLNKLNRLCSIVIRVLHKEVLTWFLWKIIIMLIWVGGACGGPESQANSFHKFTHVMLYL